MTALGVLEAPAVLRSGARSGDVVALAGTTGAVGGRPRAAVRRAARRGSPAALTAAASVLVAAHLAPRPPYAAGPDAARAGATALIDTSDGLLRDAGRIAAASGVRDRRWTARALAPGADLVAAAEALGDRVARDRTGC